MLPRTIGRTLLKASRGSSMLLRYNLGSASVYSLRAMSAQAQSANEVSGRPTDDVIVEEICNKIENLNIRQVSLLITQLKVKLNISDAMLAPAAGPVAASTAPAEAAPVEEEKEVVAERTIFDVKLLSYDPSKKIAVIKEVRGLLKLGLKEAKALVEKAPTIIKEDCPKVDCEQLVEKLKACSAVVELI